MRGRKTAGTRPGCGTWRSRCCRAGGRSRPASVHAMSPCGCAMRGWSTSASTTSRLLCVRLAIRSRCWPTTRPSRAIGAWFAMADAVRIALVFPSLLGTYGDGGNASVLAQRLRWRGIDADVVDVSVDEPLPAEADMYVLGGGEDTAQTLAVTRLADGTLARAVDAGKPVLAVCGGFQILGETWLTGAGDVHPGLGLID